MSVYINPYDFEKPVRDPHLFAGRQKELEEIDYYLELSKSEQPVFHNLALIGPRAIGKTSLLNMIQHMAEKKEMLAVKVSLNDQTSSNEVLLFKEIVDNIMTKGADKEMFGGISGNTYKLFRKAIDRLDLSVDIPFLFGTAYIGHKEGKNTGISQQVMLYDLRKVYEEAKKKEIPTIVLLFDECDLLSQNKTLLQKLRNVFSELDGYILVFSGTEKMFPDMNEVFSPIPRLFKRIDIGNFRSVEETKDCVLKPLKDEEKKLVNEVSIAEIHLLSGGNPYEVQLLSHHMYRRFKDQNASSITLDVGVLDGVLNELDRLRTAGHHEIADKIRRLITPDQIRAILATLEFPGATTEQLARFLVLGEIDSVDLQEISSQVMYRVDVISDFIGNIIRKDNEQRLTFSGDQFDVLYLKHFALSKGIKDFRFGMSNESDLNVQNKFTNMLLKDLTEYEIDIRFDRVEPLGTPDGFKGQRGIFGGKFKPKLSKPGEWVTLFNLSPVEMDKRFYQGSSDSHRFRVNVRFLGRGFVIQVTTKTPEDLDYVKRRVTELQTKLQVLGFDIVLKDEIEYNLEGHKHVTNKDYSSALIAFDNAIRLNENFELAWANKGRVQFQLQQFAEALRCFEKWSRIRPRSAEAWERIGATFINLHRYEEARTALQKAVELKPEMWVAWDNLGRAYSKLRQFNECIESMDRSLKLKTDNAGAILFKGMSSYNLGRVDDAIKLYDEVLGLDPSNEEALVNKGLALSERGDVDSALELLSGHLLTHPNNVRFLELQSLIFARKGLHDKSIENCDKILELQPNNGTAYYNRSCFNCGLGNVDRALSDLENAIQLDPRFKDVAKDERDFDRMKEEPRFKQLVYTPNGKDSSSGSS